MERLKNILTTVIFFALVISTVVVIFYIYNIIAGITYLATIIALFIISRKLRVARILLCILFAIIGLNFTTFIIWGISETNIGGFFNIKNNILVAVIAIAAILSSIMIVFSDTVSKLFKW